MEQAPIPKDREATLLAVIGLSVIVSVVMYVVIYFTLPLTRLSVSGLIVNASIFALLFFLGMLMIRYFITLIASFLFYSKYSAVEQPEYFPFISIIVPAYNEAKVIEDSVKSLLTLDYPNYEIIVVNDGSTDETHKVAEKLVGYHAGKYEKVRVSLINKENGGKSSALNSGIHFSRAEFVLCMDGDSALSSKTLRYGMRHFNDREIGAVAGNVKVMNANKMITNLQSLEYVEGLNMVRTSQSYLKMVNIIPGPIGIFRKQAIIDAGWYASDTYAEDADLTLKIRQAGWQIIYEPKAIAYTEAPESMYQLLKQRYRWTRGLLQSLKKHRERLFKPQENMLNSLVLWSMFYEAILWPSMNIFANLFLILVAVFYGMSNLIPLWWLSIALLDIMAALYCVATEKEDLKLIPYAFIYRLFFVLTIDITKVAATIEEFLGFDMTWGKLERI
ncbi:glycosyltransferase, partial [candidate division KSB1 bacterium]|nr:glycosyltransferase [candidate division KSB1 bacterium]